GRTREPSGDHRNESLLAAFARLVAEAAVADRLPPRVEHFGPPEALPGAPGAAPGDGAYLPLPERAGPQDGAGEQEAGGRAEQKPRTVGLRRVRSERSRDRDAEPDAIEGAPDVQLGPARGPDPSARRLGQTRARSGARGRSGPTLQDQRVERSGHLRSALGLERAGGLQEHGRGIRCRRSLARRGRRPARSGGREEREQDRGGEKAAWERVHG